MRSLFLLIAAVAFASGAQFDPADTETSQHDLCTVRAWVRAEDLSPDHISRGELRIKVPRKECANQIASVVLRLQLDEFGEVKFLKPGAVIPEVRPSNESAPVGHTDWLGNGVVYDYQAHDDGLNDPELWTVKAQERRVWTAEATLLDNNPNLAQPIVTPFTVAVPAVNYPPVVANYHEALHGPIPRYSFSDLGYRYFAVVTFADGRTEEVPAGYTVFIPSSQKHVQVPFTWNSTFQDFQCYGDSPISKKKEEDVKKCLPKVQRSAFVAEITLEGGNVVEKGQPLKGRVTVHTLKKGLEGLTTLSDISIDIRSLSRDHWAQSQAAAGGDVEFYNATSGLCRRSTGNQLSAASENFGHLFDELDGECVRAPRIWELPSNLPITPATPYVDFEFEVPQMTPVGFASYYGTAESLLYFQLTVSYPLDVAKCLRPLTSIPFEGEDQDSVGTEEGLWEMYIPVGQPAIPVSSWQGLTMMLEASVPISVVSSTMPEHPVAHYLTPQGALRPMLRSGVQLDMPASFPPAHPTLTVEDAADSSARLMRPGTIDPEQQLTQMLRMGRQRVPDPTKNYHDGSFAGLLWRKKMVAEERGIFPLPGDGGEGQEVFSVTP